MTVLHSAPRYASNEGVCDALCSALGDMVVERKEEHGDILITVARDRIDRRCLLGPFAHAVRSSRAALACRAPEYRKPFGMRPDEGRAR